MMPKAYSAVKNLVKRLFWVEIATLGETDRHTHAEREKEMCWYPMCENNMMILHWKHGLKEREGERDVGIICVIIYGDLALEAWTQSEPAIGFASI